MCIRFAKCKGRLCEDLSSICPEEACAELSCIGSPVLQSIADSVAGAMSPQKPSQSVYKERLEAGSQIFRSPFVSFVYERGWRQGFDWAGFPGVDKEFDLLLNLYDRTGKSRIAFGMYLN